MNAERFMATIEMSGSKRWTSSMSGDTDAGVISVSGTINCSFCEFGEKNGSIESDFDSDYRKYFVEVVLP